MLSRRQAEDLRARLAAGERITLRARVAAKMVPATFDVVVATIPGTEAAAGEVVLTAHLCHESAGVNDNASGSASRRTSPCGPRKSPSTSTFSRRQR